MTKLNSSGSALAYSTYLGGTGGDVGYGIAVDTSGAAYVTGSTESTDFPATVGAYQTANRGYDDAFVARVYEPDWIAGTSCSVSGACASGYCVDGVCCDVACDGQCEACDVVAHVGTCTPISGVPKGSRVPCTGTASTCGGICDGIQTNCTYPGGRAPCGSTCSAGVETDDVCDGMGFCVAGSAHSCMGLVCQSDGGKCMTSCAADSDCVEGFTCEDGGCVGHSLSDGGAPPSSSDAGQPPSSPSSLEGRCGCETAGAARSPSSRTNLLLVALLALCRRRRYGPNAGSS